MSINNDLPTVLIKRKNIQTIFDYCLDNKVEFSVKEKPFTVEEFEVTLQITEIKKAIAFGFFARENKLEIVGVNDQQTQPKAPAKRNSGTTANTAATAPKPVEIDLTKKESLPVADANEETEEAEEDNGLDLKFSPSLNLS